MRKILIILFLLPHLNATAQKKPNILLFIGDDMTWRDCSVYGNPDVNTPNIQRLADTGMSFDNMFTATAMCSPTRQQILTGLFPARSGAYPNHAKVYDGVKSLGHHFKALGYNVALIGKQHYGPAESYPIDYLGGRQHDGGNGIDIHLDKIKPVIEDDKPFLLIIAQNQPHTPWTRGNRAQYNPEKLTVPDYMIDTKETREALVKYYAEITYADSLLGYCLDAVEKVGKQKNTIEVFTSEQGYQLPFGKWTCYDLGLKTGFIISWPGKVPAKSRNSAFIQYVDILPTLLDMVGADPEKIDVGIKDTYGNTGFDGKSFYDVIQQKTDHHRDYVFGIQTTRGIFSGSDSYPVRSIRTEKYKYIQNYSFDSEFSNIPIANENSLYNQWLRDSTLSEDTHAWLEKYKTRPFEELYDLENDPFEQRNLAEDKTYKSIIQDLRQKLESWMIQQGDLGVATEMKARERMTH